MKKIVIVLVAMMFVLATASAFAETATSSLQVSANVAASCRISSVTNVVFTNPYDPTDPANNDSGTGDFSFRCTRGTSYDLYITGTRQMASGGDTLNFELYTNAARTTTWPSSSPGVTGTSGSNAPITRDIYGRINALQDVQAGAYTGTVTITVQY